MKDSTSSSESVPPAAQGPAEKPGIMSQLLQLLIAVLQGAKRFGVWLFHVSDLGERAHFLLPLKDAFRIFTALGVIALLLLSVTSDGGFFKTLATIALIGGSAAAVGGAIGFLFGIPRMRATPAEGEDEESSVRVRNNTNLEQVSDWLTKILVAVGLVELNNIASVVQELSLEIQTVLGGDQATGMAGVAFTIYAFVLGFFTSYLTTRLFLVEIFIRTDAERIMHQLEEKTSQLEQDKHSVLVVRAFLLQGEDAESDDQLRETIQAASEESMKEIFVMTKDYRYQAWRDRSLDMMDRIATVLSMLRDTKVFAHSHRLDSQLAYALKDKAQPEWARAERLLAGAIERAKKAGEAVSSFYWFNWAKCQIELTRQMGPLARAEVDRIIEALKQTNDIRLQRAILEDKHIKDWMEVNSSDLAGLRHAWLASPTAT